MYIYSQQNRQIELVNLIWQRGGKNEMNYYITTEETAC